MARRLHIWKLGRVEYGDGLALMERAAPLAVAGEDQLFLVEHPPVLTLGRGANQANIVASPAWLEKQGFEVHPTDRGGDVTYHGPGQVVGYPVLDLGAWKRDVRAYVAALEEAMIRTCADYGLAAGRHEEHRGAWVGTRKIGAVGVHISRWVSSHGFAFNANADLEHFRAIVPCGIADPRLGVTSLARELGREVDYGEVTERLAAHLTALFERERVDREPELRTVSVVPVRDDGQVLLLKRTPERGGIWQVVTGRVEPGEAPEAAARRELFEETGADAPVRDLGYEHALSVDPALLGRDDALVLARERAFAARLPAGFACRLSAEHAEHAFLTPGDALARLPYAGLRRAVKLSVSRSAR